MCHWRRCDKEEDINFSALSPVQDSPLSPGAVSLSKVISSAEEPRVGSCLLSYRWTSRVSEGLGKGRAWV